MFARGAVWSSCLLFMVVAVQAPIPTPAQRGNEGEVRRITLRNSTEPPTRNSGPVRNSDDKRDDNLRSGTAMTDTARDGIDPARDNTTIVNNDAFVRDLQDVSNISPPPVTSSQEIAESQGGSTMNRGVLEITVISSREQVFISVNGIQAVNVTDTSSSNETVQLSTAGLYLVLLSQYDGSVIMKEVYNFHLFANSLGLPTLLTALAKGRVMVLAVKTESALNMPKVVRNLLQEFGSLKAHQLPHRGYLAWVLSSWGPTWGEAVDQDPLLKISNDKYGSPVHLHVTIPLAEEGGCWGQRSGREGERAAFCLTYDGYGDLCNCEDPAPLTYPEIPLENSVTDDVPVAIIASSRPQLLYRLLVTLLRQEGGTRRRLLALVDGHHEELLALLRLFQVRYQVNDMKGQYFVTSGTRISQHYKFALNATFNLFANATKAIVLEEDLLVAPDFFSYFNQTAWLLDADPSLFCISAWNDLGALHSARHPHRLYRIECHAGNGWMLTRQHFEAIFPIWPSAHQDHDWDIWMRTEMVRGGRECVVPDVSRTFHNGMTGGAHVQGALTHTQFTGHPVTTFPAIPLKDVHRLTLVEYEEDLYKILLSENTYYLNSTMHPCSTNYIPKNFTTGPVVIFMKMDNMGHYSSWQKIGACLGVWHLDPRSQHKGLFRFNYYQTEIIVIGYPFSDYSFLKPKGVHVVSEPTKKEEHMLGVRTMENRYRFRVPQLEHWSPYLILETSTLEPLYIYR